MRWMTSLTPLVMSSRGPPVIGCTFFFLTGTSWRRRSPRPPPSTLPLHGRPAGRTSGRRGRGAAWLGRSRLRPPSVPPLPWPAGQPRFGPPRPRRCSARPVTPQAAVRAPLPWPAGRASGRRGRVTEQPRSPCYAPSPTLRCRHSYLRRARHRRPSVVGAASSAQIQPGPCRSSLLPTKSPHCRLPQAPPAPRSRLRPSSALPLPWLDAEPLPVLHSPSCLGSPRCPRRCSARPPTPRPSPRRPTSTPRRSTPAIGRHATRAPRKPSSGHSQPPRGRTRDGFEVG